MQQYVAQKQQEKQENPRGAEANDKRANAFSEARLQEVWQSLAASKKEDIRSYIILNREVKLLENQVVHLELTNQIQLDNFHSLKHEWLRYLKDQLQNDHIQLSAELVKQEEQKRMLYTASDKYRYLSEKYALVEQLRSRFGLDLED